jgi:hypothetical protein
MEPVDFARTRYRVESVREPGLGAGGLVHERQRTYRSAQVLRKPLRVLAGLGLDTDERRASLLGLQDSGRDPVKEKQVVSNSVTGRERDFADSDPSNVASLAAGVKVDGSVVLHDPASGLEHRIYLSPSLPLRGQVGVAGDTRHTWSPVRSPSIAACMVRSCRRSASTYVRHDVRSHLVID